MAAGGDLTPVYYIVSIGGVLVTGLWSMRKYISSQKEKWTKEGKSQADLTSAIDHLNDSAKANATATERNTRAIDKLSGDLRNFSDQTVRQLNAQDGRLIRLETRAGMRKNSQDEGE